jgi:hypothetical protein
MPIIAYAPLAADLVDWLWRNRADLGPYVEGLIDRVLSRDGTSVERVGAAIVAGPGGSDPQVIGLLTDLSARTDAVGAAVTRLEAGQALLGQSLTALQNLSLVGLGVSAFSFAALSWQLGLLNRRLKELDRQVRRLHVTVEAAQEAEIDTGLMELQRGTEHQGEDARRHFGEALTRLSHSANIFARRLAAELDQKDADREGLRLLARYMTVAALGEAAAEVGRGQAQKAARTLEEVRLPALRAYARRVFAETAGADPARFLIPAMAAHGVTLDYLAGLHHQAALARIDGTADYKGPADLFEALRPGLYQARDPVFRTATRVARLRRELAEAASAVEEVNRVQGLALAARQFDRPDRPFRELMGTIDREIAACVRADGPGTFVYVPPPEDAPARAGGAAT